MNLHKPERLKTFLLTNSTGTGQLLSPAQVELFFQYYQLVLKWNPQLHLTTITAPAEFWQRHIFESLFLAQHLLPVITEVWDLGSGLGIPGIPLAILRPDLSVKLIEANRRKAVFLEEALFQLDLANSSVLNRRFEALPLLPCGAAVTARAVEKMEAVLPKIFKLAECCAQVLFLGGNALVQTTQIMPPAFSLTITPVPNAQASFLINLSRST